MISMMSAFPALIVSIFLTLLVLFAILRLDWYGMGKFHLIGLAFIGGMMAELAAGLIRAESLSHGWLTDEQFIGTITPIIEELFKAGVLFYLVHRADFNYVVDGTTYGFAAGLGFAFLETLPNVDAVFWRSLSTNLFHAAMGALVGSTLAVSRFERGVKQLLISGSIIIIAIYFHREYNVMIDAQVSLIWAFAVGFLGLTLTASIVNWGLKIQRRWITESLGMTDRVTSAEAAVVGRIPNVTELLAPLTRQFGRSKTDQIISLLRMEAELGLKRRLAQKATDDRTRTIIEEEINHMAPKIKSLRRKIGVYRMIFVRSVYLAPKGSLWELIEQRVSESGLGPAGGGLWLDLENRLRASKSRGEV